MAFNVEELFDSIKVIVTEELNNQSFDSTVICTIVEDANKESGHYIVSDGTIKFDAYTNDSSYEKGDQVRVSVLNGDYSQRKFIVGPYVADTSGAPVVYVSPTGTTVATTQNLLTSNIGTSVNKFNAQSETRLQANGATKNLVLWKTSIAEDSKYYDLQADNIYNIITLSAKFKTAFVDVLSGNYGLRLDLLFTPEKGSNERIQKFITFDSDEMIGNPYSFVIPTPQQTQINIGVTGIVTEMVLSAYQGITIDKHGREISSPFVDLNNKAISTSNTITIQDIELGFASDLTSIDNNTLQIYTNSSLGYVYNDGYGSDEQNLKEIGLLWYNKTDNSEYTGFSDGLADNVNFGNGNEPYDEAAWKWVEKFIANLENILSSNLKDYCTNPLFYSFPIKQIETIIEKSKINDIYTICNILSKASEYKIEEAPLLLQCFNSQTITMDANTKIITSLSKIPICMELKELKENDAQIDYFFEIKEKDKEIEELKKEIKRYTKPDDFVYDIFEATENGKLSSVKYLIFYHSSYIFTPFKKCSKTSVLNFRGGVGINYHFNLF